MSRRRTKAEYRHALELAAYVRDVNKEYCRFCLTVRGALPQHSATCILAKEPAILRPEQREQLRQARLLPIEVAVYDEIVELCGLLLALPKLPGDEEVFLDAFRRIEDRLLSRGPMRAMGWETR